MTKYVLAADSTLLTEYRNIPLATFFSCIPSDYWYSRLVHRILANAPQLDRDGRPIRVPNGLRKIEAALVKAEGRESVEIVDPRFLREHISDDTEIVGLHTMDPLGLGPVSMSFTLGGRLTPYTKYMFHELVAKAQVPGRKFKVALGGPGAWQFEHKSGAQEQLGIDHIVQGEVDHKIAKIFRQITDGQAPPVLRFDHKTAPSIEEIPRIIGPTMQAMVEVMRGCGRGCEFCEVTRRPTRYFPLDYIAEEVRVNSSAPQGRSIQLHADDIFAYRVENHRTMEPNADALKELFQRVVDQPGVETCYPTHGTVSGVVANPELITDLSKIVKAGPNRWVGIQCGAETGSPSLAKAALKHKAAPFTPEEWPDLVVKGTEILNRNHWFPAFTVIMGLPGETTEDAWQTVDLIERMEQVPNNHFIVAPLAFVPVGALRGAEFYDLTETIDEARFNVAFYAWRHNVIEIDKSLWRLMTLPLPMRAIITALARVGSRSVLNMMEKFAHRQGIRIKRPATTAREIQGHILAPLPSSGGSGARGSNSP